MPAGLLIVSTQLPGYTRCSSQEVQILDIVAPSRAAADLRRRLGSCKKVGCGIKMSEHGAQDCPSSRQDTMQCLPNLWSQQSRGLRVDVCSAAGA